MKNAAQKKVVIEISHGIIQQMVESQFTIEQLLIIGGILFLSAFTQIAIWIPIFGIYLGLGYSRITWILASVIIATPLFMSQIPLFKAHLQNLQKTQKVTLIAITCAIIFSLASGFLAPLEGTWAPLYYFSPAIRNGGYHLPIMPEDWAEPSAIWATLIVIYGYCYPILLVTGIGMAWLPKINHYVTKRAITQVSKQLKLQQQTVKQIVSKITNQEV